MKTITLTAHNCFELQDRPTPIPQADEVLVQIQAAGFNPVDYKLAQGTIPTQLPAVLGHDFAGVVAAPHSDFALGTPVFGYLPGPHTQSNGAFAEFVAVPKTLLTAIPAPLTLTQAAAYPLAALTAYQSVMRTPHQAGATAFVAGATGGVGLLVVQLLQHLGISVVTLARSTAAHAKLQRQTQLTPAQIISLTEHDTVASLSQAAQQANHGARFDYTFDLVGGQMKELCLTLTDFRGHCVTIVEEQHFPIDIWNARQSPLFQRSVTCHLEFLGAEAYFGEPRYWARYQQDLQAIAPLIAQGVFHFDAIQVLTDFSVSTLTHTLKALQERTGQVDKWVLEMPH